MKIKFRIKGLGRDVKKAKKDFDRFFKKAHRKARCKKCKRIHLLSM
jgi:hypothetical protein